MNSFRVNNLYEQLSPAVIGGSANISSESRQKIISLSGARPVRFIVELIFNWLIIAVLTAVGIYYSNPWVTVLCIIVIGSRQLVLGLLLHEQVHRLGLKGKYGDWIVNLLAVYPLLLTTVEDYAKIHLSHHKYFFTKQDPDHIRKSGKEWTFPMSINYMLQIILSDLSGLNTIRVIKGKTASRTMFNEFERRHSTPKWVRLIYYIGIAGILTLIEGWETFLIFWIVPLLTTFQLFLRWLAVCEHLYNSENAKFQDVTPLIELTWWQKIFFPNLNFSMHVYHHEHPGVSFSNLPKVHEIYKQQGLVNENAVFHGYGAYLKFLLGHNGNN